jgi:hypothetical protein
VTKLLTLGGDGGGQRVTLDYRSQKARPYVCAMSASYCHDSHDDDPQRGNPAYRRVLWIVLAINAVMFAVEISDLIRWRAARPRSR